VLQLIWWTTNTKKKEGNIRTSWNTVCIFSKTVNYVLDFTKHFFCLWISTLLIMLENCIPNPDPDSQSHWFPIRIRIHKVIESGSTTLLYFLKMTLWRSHAVKYNGHISHIQQLCSVLNLKTSEVKVAVFNTWTNLK
jgi:hypothetical protein